MTGSEPPLLQPQQLQLMPFSTLCMPGRLSTTGNRLTLPLTRTQSKRIWPAAAAGVFSTHIGRRIKAIAYDLLEICGMISRTLASSAHNTATP